MGIQKYDFDETVGAIGAVDRPVSGGGEGLAVHPAGLQGSILVPNGHRVDRHCFQSLTVQSPPSQPTGTSLTPSSPHFPSLNTMDLTSF